MPSYLATIRYEASGDGEANLIATQWAAGAPVKLRYAGALVEVRPIDASPPGVLSPAVLEELRQMMAEEARKVMRAHVSAGGHNPPSVHR